MVNGVYKTTNEKSFAELMNLQLANLEIIEL